MRRRRGEADAVNGSARKHQRTLSPLSSNLRFPHLHSDFLKIAREQLRLWVAVVRDKSRIHVPLLFELIIQNDELISLHNHFFMEPGCKSFDTTTDALSWDGIELFDLLTSRTLKWRVVLVSGHKDDFIVSMDDGTVSLEDEREGGRTLLWILMDGLY